MPTTLQFRRDTTAGVSGITGAIGEIIVDTTKKTVTVHDGSTAGGTPLAKETDTRIVNALQPSDVDDTPVDGATTAPISSNWAYDHNASTSAHSMGTAAQSNVGDFAPTKIESATPPLNPVSGQEWYDTTSGITLTYYGTSWVATPQVSTALPANASQVEAEAGTEVNSRMWSPVTIAHAIQSRLSVVALALSGPTTTYTNYTYSWYISDYDSFSTYSVSASSGTISRNNDVITFIAPSIAGTVTLTFGVNGNSRNIILTVLQSSGNDIGMPGDQGFGVGIYPNAGTPAGFSSLTGTTDPSSSNYGNYQYSDGSIMCWIPKFYYRIGSASSPRYGIYGVNSVDIATAYDFIDETAANLAGYALHRAFKNGGAIKNGFMIDKYQCSNNSGIASSISYGNPLSSAAAHNPFSGLNGNPANFYYGALDAAKTRGVSFHCASRFQFAALALLSLAHGQAASSITNCAWYNAGLVTNYPKGNNNNALCDVDDTTVKWQSDGYLACGKTGSAGYGGGVGNYFAKSTHNGQNSGVADLNGNLWEINIGITRPGTSSGDSANQNDATAFYILKESVDVNALTAGWSNVGSGNEAWGTAAHLATLYDPITMNHIANNGVTNRWGNGTNQVLSSAVSGDGYRMTSSGIASAGGVSGAGTNLFGVDYFYEYHVANLCLLSGGYWGNATSAGVWNVSFGDYRTSSDYSVGFRAGAYV